MNKPTREEIEVTYRGMKEQILKSNILLLPKWSKIDEDALDYIVEESINITLKPSEEVTPDETRIMKILISLTSSAIDSIIKGDEVINNRIYDSFVSGEMDELSDDYKEFMRKKIKEGLITHEQYEKIKNVDTPKDND